MGKATIIEAQNSSAVYEEGKSKGILGKLKGVFADYKNGTRNADRLYTEDLWDNRVFGSEDVMEALETRTLFGELDHPEGDRCETLAKNAAITITKLEKRPEEGVIYGEAEILDTPTGRILKALADSGAKLGISSRGMGEEIYVEGKNIIDPETYDFITFDVVVTPANTKARVSLTESKKLNMLTESFKKEIEESETVNQLSQVKTVLESVNTESKDELINLVETKINEITKPVVNTKLQEANEKITINILKKKLAEVTEQLNESIDAGSALTAENTKLIEENTFYKESRETLKSKLKESKEAEYGLKNQIQEANTKLDEANTQLNESKNEVLVLNKKLEESKAKLDEEAEKEKIEESRHIDETVLKMKQINQKKIENLEVKHQEEITRLNEELNKKETRVNNLLEANKQLTKSVEGSNKLLNENKELQKQLEQLKLNESNNQKRLQESKILENNKVKALEKEIAMLKQKVSESADLQERFSKLSFTPMGTVKALTENFKNNDIDDEDKALFEVLTKK